MALRAGSPTSRRPPTMKAPTSVVKSWANTTASGKAAKATNVAITNGRRPTRSASRAAGR